MRLPHRVLPADPDLRHGKLVSEQPARARSAFSVCRLFATRSPCPGESARATSRSGSAQRRASRSIPSGHAGPLLILTPGGFQRTTAGLPRGVDS